VTVADKPDGIAGVSVEQAKHDILSTVVKSHLCKPLPEWAIEREERVMHPSVPASPGVYTLNIWRYYVICWVASIMAYVRLT
jgi:hypothetical protein